MPILDEPPVRLPLQIRVDDARHPAQCIRGLRHAVFRQQRRGPGDHDSHVCDLPRDKRGIRHRGDTQRHIDPLIDKIDISILEPQIEVHIREFLQELEDGRRQRPFAEIAWRRNAQQAARRCRLIGNRGVEIVELLQQLAGFAVIGLARLGQRQLAGRPVHQPHAEIVLEIGHVFAEQRLRPPILPGRRGKPAGVKHLHEGPDAREILCHQVRHQIRAARRAESGVVDSAPKIIANAASFVVREPRRLAHSPIANNEPPGSTCAECTSPPVTFWARLFPIANRQWKMPGLTLVWIGDRHWTETGLFTHRCRNPARIQPSIG